MVDGAGNSALMNKLVEAIAPEAAFLRATDDGARFSPGVPGLTEAAQLFYNLLATGFAGAIALEVVKGLVGEAGKFLGAKLMAWRSAAPDPSTRGLDDAGQLFSEAKKALGPDQFSDALAVAGAALRERLVDDGFPPARAERLSAAIARIAQEHADVAG